MKQRGIILPTVLLHLLLTASCAATIESSPSGTAPREALVQGNTAFAIELYGQLGEKDNNTFFSPFSVSSAISMAYAGARENTAKEMRDVLHFQLGQAELHPAFKRLNQTLAADVGKGGQKLNIANALVLTGGDVSKEYKAILKNDYDAEIFWGGLNDINNWVKKKTETKIEKILDELDANSVCVILNAIYFKGIWERQFEKSRTHDAPFSTSATTQVNVPFMHQTSDFKLLTEDDFQAISIFYKGKNLSMVIFLPNTMDGLTALEEKLNPQRLAKWMAD